MAAPFLTFQAPRLAAKLRVASSSVAPVAYGYERSLPPCDTRFSRPVGVACSEGDC
jgi:hypothetical protein